MVDHDTAETGDWLKVPSEVALSMGVSIDEAKQLILAGRDTPLKRRLQADYNFEEKLKRKGRGR